MSKGKARELRNKIRSVQNTEKITKAMQLVSASKLRKASQALESFQSYFGALTTILEEVSAGENKNAYLKESVVTKACVVVFSGERSLCGAYNSNATKAALATETALVEQGFSVCFAAIGRKAAEALRAKNKDVIWEYNLSGTLPSKKESEALGKRLSEFFKSSEIGRIELVYTEFKSAASKSTQCSTYLPIVVSTQGQLEDAVGRDGQVRKHYLLEPNRKEVLEKLLDTYLTGRIHEVFIHSLASEYGSRMIAMDNASKNAKEMIETLTLKLNRARQAAITQEIAEIVGGAASLEQ